MEFDMVQTLFEIFNSNNAQRVEIEHNTLHKNNEIAKKSLDLNRLRYWLKQTQVKTSTGSAGFDEIFLHISYRGSKQTETDNIFMFGAPQKLAFPLNTAQFSLCPIVISIRKL